MCMELLMTQGWSSVYTAEAIILQVAATIVRGKGRVNFEALNVSDAYAWLMLCLCLCEGGTN